jgi:hypothetical protein
VPTRPLPCRGAVVFAVWGLSGFGYPSAPLPYALNVLSKIYDHRRPLARRAWLSERRVARCGPSEVASSVEAKHLR